MKNVVGFIILAVGKEIKSSFCGVLYVLTLLLLKLAVTLLQG